MVASAKDEATRAGAAVLEKGGNAFDAAVAVGFALGVCEPFASGIGGGGYMTSVSDGNTRFLDFREVAPLAAGPDMWVQTTPEAFECGPLVAAIPGQVAGMCAILSEMGTMDLGEVLEPSIRICTEGFAVTPLLKEMMTNQREKLAQYAPDSVFGRSYEVGNILKNPDLAHTLRIIADKGAAGFYGGAVAQTTVGDINRFGGIWTMEDLQKYRVRWLEPLVSTYRGYDLITAPLPSCGGIQITEIFNILENFDVGRIPYHSAAHLHLLSEVFRLTFSDRQRYVGDPDYVRVPIKGLLSKDYAAVRACDIDLHRAKAYAPGRPFAYESPDTSHFCVADSFGNMVAITQSISGYFGCGVVPAGLGFPVNNQMRCFSTDPTSVNAAESGKKPLSSMSPTIIARGGQPIFAVGSPGGNRIITALTQTISNLIDYAMPLEDSVNAPRIFDDNHNVLCCEGGIAPAALEALQAMGHNVRATRPNDWFFGGVHAIGVSTAGDFHGAADPRRDGTAIGVCRAAKQA
jgi:gamma-glutamyltranspeptidase/glutathione hydrolase